MNFLFIRFFFKGMRHAEVQKIEMRNSFFFLRDSQKYYLAVSFSMGTKLKTPSFSWVSLPTFLRMRIIS